MESELALFNYFSFQKNILIILAIVASVSCQIYTKIQEDGYHYDKPNIDIRFNLPNDVPKTPLPVKPDTKAQPAPLPPLPAFIPQINLPKVLPVKPAALPVKPDTPAPSVVTLPQIPSFLPQINLPKVIPVKPSLPVKPDLAPRIEPVVPDLPPIPSFLPQINLPRVIPIKPAPQPLPVKPEVQKPAPFAAPRVNVQASNEYLPPVTNDYLPPVSNDILTPAEDLTEWDQYKVRNS